MHLFLYQAARHTPPASPYQYSNNRNRYKQGTIRGDFDLELLKRGIKGRYSILPHGEHEFQKMLPKMDLQEEFYGHIVQIEEKKNAVWFKLNYDQVGRHVTKYVGGWRDLDPADLSSVVLEYEMHKKSLQVVNTHASQARYYSSQLVRVAEGFESKPLACIDGLASHSRESSKVFADAWNALNVEAGFYKGKMEACQQVVKNYLAERKL